jgi:hypothetical protein
MTNFSPFRVFPITLHKPLFLLLVLLFMISACINTPQSSGIDSSSYTTENLAKDWRAQVRKNPNNPFEGAAYPADNDSGYYAPKKNISKVGSKRTPMRQGQGYYDVPNDPGDNDDSSYGRFPRYNPDDDNVYTDSKNYPLYQD